MIEAKTRTHLMVIALCYPLFACGSDAPPPYALPPFDDNGTEIAVGHSHTLQVFLNRPAETEVQVDLSVEAPHEDALELRPSRLIFGPSQNRQALTIKGVSETQGKFAVVRLVVVETNFPQVFRIKVDLPVL